MYKHYIWMPLCLSLVMGCGETGPRKYHYKGAITLDSEPVAAGLIIFEPDPTKGNSGPQGSAVIRDGKYNTRTAPGKGCVGGASIIKIDLYDGLNPTEITPYGTAIRSRYEVTQELPLQSDTVDFDVPSTQQ